MSDQRYETDLTGSIIEGWLAVFRRQKAFAEHAFDQLDDEPFFRAPGAGLNSVGVIAQHMSGNMLSRWTDFLTTDGEKDWRDRDAELTPPDLGSTPEDRAAARARIMHEWERAWKTLLDSIASLAPEDISREVTIRGVPHAVHAAVARALDHYGFHVGQINTVGRWLVGTDNWRWFTLPPGGTGAFNERLRNRPAGDGTDA